MARVINYLDLSLLSYEEEDETRLFRSTIKYIFDYKLLAGVVSPEICISTFSVAN